MLQDFTLSIQLSGAFKNESHASDVDWPIYVHTKDTLPVRATWRDRPPNAELVRTGFSHGDAILFRGRWRIHHRENMPDDVQRLTSFLLHYVPRAFDLHDYKLVRQKADPTL